MSDRIAATEAATSREIAAPRQNTARSESNCFDANESVRTALLHLRTGWGQGGLARGEARDHEQIRSHRFVEHHLVKGNRRRELLAGRGLSHADDGPGKVDAVGADLAVLADRLRIPLGQDEAAGVAVEVALEDDPGPVAEVDALAGRAVDGRRP